MPGLKSTLKDANDSWQLFYMQRPWVKEVSKACFRFFCCPVACCYSCMMADCGLRPRCKPPRRPEQARKKLEMFNLHIRKRERQHRRRHSLTEERNTISRLDAYLRGREAWCDQESSIFFSKLPAELRMKIYSFVLNEEGQLLIRPEHETFKFQIDNSFLEDKPDVFPDKRRTKFRGMTEIDILRVERDRRLRSLLPDFEHMRALTPIASLPFLLTCRRVYSEALSLLYSGNTFVTYFGYHLEYFTRSIPKVHLNHITSLVLYMWISHPPDLNSTDRGLSNLKNLKSCRVIILYEKNLFTSDDHYGLRHHQMIVEHVVVKYPNKDIFMIEVWCALRDLSDEDLEIKDYVCMMRWNGRDDSIGRTVDNTEDQ